MVLMHIACFYVYMLGRLSVQCPSAVSVLLVLTNNSFLLGF